MPESVRWGKGLEVQHDKLKHYHKLFEEQRSGTSDQHPRLKVKAGRHPGGDHTGSSSPFCLASVSNSQGQPKERRTDQGVDGRL